MEILVTIFSFFTALFLTFIFFAPILGFLICMVILSSAIKERIKNG